MVERQNDRPNHLDLTGTAFTDHHRFPLQSPGELAPPKPGDIPPALSPLDAFAFQSRLLARKFEEERDGKRLSRLPHLTIQNEFAKRPGYFRSASSEASSAFGESPLDETLNMGTLQEAPRDARPLSMYPSLEDGDASSSPQKPVHKLPEIGEEETETPQNFHTAQPIQPPTDYFGVPRAASPEQIETRVERPTPETPSSRLEEKQQTSPPANFDALSINSVTSPNQGVTSPNQGLRPPRSPLAMKNSPSIRSVYDSSLDDVDAFSMGSMDSLPPRMPSSTSSSYSRSHSPAIPFQIPLPRSPSVQSESSWTSGPHLNFSRPLSAISRPSLDRRATNESAPYRQGTMDSTSDRISLDVPSRQDTGDLPLTPMTLASEDSFTGAQDMNASHYTYTKYPLPRGRPLNRESIAPGDFIIQQFQWDDELASGRISLSRSPSPNLRRPHTPPYTTPPHLTRRSEDARTSSSGSPRQRRTLHKPNRSSPSKYPDRSLDYIKSSASSTLTSSDASTIKAQLDSSKPPSILDLTPEQHLQRGIELHEAGSLQKSTYHLRNAAKAGLPTAMLLYALACRHGWGMRASQADGVAWLQRAVDSAQLECADDEDLVARGAADPSSGPARKTHKAQFALSVYELGMSYMNGWGVRQDRALGLRCFEVAGNWGDADALAEAAFCYAEGHGCKKDLRKAARLYREAERRGMSMAGNSWIYKEKYMDDTSGSEGRRSRPTTKSGTADKGARDKSRTRGIFSRKKSFAKETAA